MGKAFAGKGGIVEAEAEEDAYGDEGGDATISELVN